MKGKANFQYLKLTGNEIGNKGTGILASVLDGCGAALKLKELHLQECNIHDRGAKHLKQIIAGSPSLAVLNLEDIFIPSQSQGKLLAAAAGAGAKLIFENNESEEEDYESEADEEPGGCGSHSPSVNAPCNEEFPNTTIVPAYVRDDVREMLRNGPPGFSFCC